MKDEHETFVLELEQIIAEKHLLKHPFYQAWSEGRLDKECLKVYAMQYYHHVQAFPGYLSALHSHTECPKARKCIAQNLADEELGSPNHPELWREFVLSLGATEEEINQHKPNAQIQKLISNFQNICREGHVADGVAALYSYESQIPEVSISKIDGLKKFYGMKEPKEWEYFTVHIEADKEHAAVERRLLLNSLEGANKENVKNAVQTTVDGLWNFLSGLTMQFEIDCAMPA